MKQSELLFATKIPAKDLLGYWKIKKKCFGYVLIEKPLAENIIKVNNLCPL